MKIDTKRLDHIIEEVLEEVLSEQSSGPYGGDGAMVLPDIVVTPEPPPPDFGKDKRLNWDSKQYERAMSYRNSELDSVPGLRKKWEELYNESSR